MVKKPKRKDKLTRRQGFRLLRRWARMETRRKPPSNFVGGIIGAILLPLLISLMGTPNERLSQFHGILVDLGLSPDLAENVIFFAFFGLGALIGIFIQKQVRKFRNRSVLSK